MEPMQKYIDPRETTDRPFWTQSHGSTVDSGNYVSPRQAIDIKYGLGKDKYKGQVPIWVRNKTILPKIIIPNKTGIEGRSTADMPGADSVKSITNAYTRYPIGPQPVEPGIDAIPVPDVYASDNVEAIYSSPFTKVKEFFDKIWWAIKIFFMKILSKIGLYKGTIPINPYKMPEYLPGIPQTPAADEPNPIQSINDTTPSSTAYYGTEPFYNHTVIFSQEVLP